eukprot:1634262-Rhodomonas_salina.1
MSAVRAPRASHVTVVSSASAAPPANCTGRLSRDWKVTALSFALNPRVSSGLGHVSHGSEHCHN